MTQKLRVLARGTALVPNYEAHMARRNAFLGWKCLPKGPEFDDPETGQKMRHAAFIKQLGAVCEVPARAEYLRHLRDRDLWPADQATAQVACVPYDPSYGDEHGEPAKAEQEAELEALPFQASSEISLS